ncbi:hypothetical protein Patl1_29956 [Pistacia atlantica]|uniref:Uncharacterized protein n=1 Tax=Pistacia atlantica TaxID=434234 RepID=A0ACC1AEA1_9ROSI|nr:hypothetical protein Patl1_29956 [Pistacia atlantica]
MERRGEVSMHRRHEMNDTIKKGDMKRGERRTRGLIVEDDEKGDINTQADAFIRNFKNQLRIHREESFKRYQEIIARGV